MRKLLLASTAMLGAATGLASAQAPAPAAANMMMAPSQGQMALPWAQGPAANNNNNSYGQPSTYAGGAAFAKNAVPTPGTVVIRLNGKVEFDALASWGTANVGYSAAGVTTGKVNPIAFGAFMRLYPGVDGMATNGLRYGASIELRENFPGSGAQPTPALAPAPSGSAYTSGQTVLVRRAFAYLAADNVGMVRMGTGDGLIGLFDPCIFSAQCWDAGVGNFNGGQQQAQAAGGGVAIPFAWLAQAGAEYGNVKIVYMSPQFMGFDFGVQYAPSMGNGFSACGAGVQAAATCNSATSSNAPGVTDSSRWYNQVAVGGRYQGTFGPLSLGVYAVYETAAKESTSVGTQFDNLSFVSAATYVNYDTGVGQVTWSFDYIGGALNGQLAMRPKGGANEDAFLTGLLYRNGPITLGAEAGLVQSQGSTALVGVSQRREWEVAFGGNYNIAPGIYLVGEYMYEFRHQGAFDFNGAGRPGTHDGKSQGILFSTVVNW